MVLAVFAACSDPGEDVTIAGTPGGRDDRLFVSIEVGGGYVFQGHDFRQPPSAVVYSDGSAFAPGAITLQYPGPAVLPVYRTEVTPAQLEQILETAQEAGLTAEERDYGNPPVIDVATTTITVVADGQTHVTAIYALGVPPPPPPADSPDGGSPAVSAEAREARQQAQEFVDLVGSMVSREEAVEFEPDRYRLLPMAVPDYGPAPEGEEGVEHQVRDWPFPQISLTADQCAVVAGPDAATFRELLRQSNEMTHWRTPSDDYYRLAVRPVLPHEPDCPEGPEPGSP